MSTKSVRLSLLPLLLLLACAPGGPVEQESTEIVARAESPELGLVLVGIPDTFAVGDPSRLHLIRQGELVGEIWVEKQAGTFNLVQAVNDWKEEYEGMPEGRFLGQLELGTQLGPAYTVRGRFTDEGEKVEERRILTLDPGGGGLVHMVYRYPEESDSQARGQEMFGIFAGLEPLASPAPAEG